MRVTALLVSHDGARWLPAVLEALAGQSRATDRVLAVDTGSTDGSLDLLRDALGAEHVQRLPADTSFPEAVQHGLRRLGEPAEDEWLWLLHDDCRPEPDALERLCEAAEADPTLDVLGPKLREWPSLRRLLEVGLTISGTGRRETGLERGEYDQGQHDRSRDVLAVSSAGMLIRRRVLTELGGFDRALPIYGNDIDLGWRAARAGHRTRVVPDAVCFHVEAASRGLRRTPVTGSSARRGERRAALYTLLANRPLLTVPFVAVRLLLGTLLRALGLLLVRAPREAGDELAALVATFARPDRILRGRWVRRRTARVRHADVKPLLAPFWLPYRHGLDAVGDLVSAIARQAADVSAARRAAAAQETGPVSAEAESLPADTGYLARLVASPAAGVFAGLVLLSLVAARGLYGSGFLSGGALLPAPTSAAAWWSRYLESWHEIGVGSAVPAAPYVLALAVAGSLLLTKAWLLLDLLFLLAVPLAAWGAWRLLRRLTGSPWASLWGAVTYGLYPVVAGAVAQGRLGTVAAAALLPWVVHAALFLATDQSQDRRWRAAWRTALLLAVLAAFVPAAWAVAVLLALVTVVGGGFRAPARWRGPRAWAPVVVSVAAVPVLLLPWVLAAALGELPTGWWTEAGLRVEELASGLGPWQLVTARPTTGPGAAPEWITLGLVVAAVGALVPRSPRPAVLACWTVILIGLATALVLGYEGAYAGFPLLLAYAAAVVAVTVVAPGMAGALSGSSFGWRQPLGLLVVLGAVLAPVVSLVWWATAGVADPLERRPGFDIPTYMVDAAERDPANGVLVLRGEDGGIGWSLVRGPGVRTGDDTVQPEDDRAEAMTDLVTRLATDPTTEEVRQLSRHGVEFVYADPATPGGVVSGLDSVSGLSPASAPRPGSRGWQVDADPSMAEVTENPSSLHPWLVALQALALLVAAVLAAPSRRYRR